MSFNSFGVMKAVFNHKVLGKRTPVNVSISVTNRCNMKCSYCDIPYRKQREDGWINELRTELHCPIVS